MECDILGCDHDAVYVLVGLCLEHANDLKYWQAQQEENRANTDIPTYIKQKNRELLG